MSSIVTLQQIGLSEIQILLEFMTNALYFVLHIATHLTATKMKLCHKNLNQLFSLTNFLPYDVIKSSEFLNVCESSQFGKFWHTV